MMNSAWMMWLAGGFLLAVLPLLWLMQRNALLVIQTGVAEDRKTDSKPAGAVPRRPISKQLGRLPIYRESGDVWREARQRSRRVAGLALLLRHAGIVNPREQLALTASGLLLAALVVGLVGVVLATTESFSWIQVVFYGLLSALSTLLVLYHALRKISETRQQRIEDEAPMLIQVTRMLWRVGLSLPRTLSVLCDELQHLAPESSRELRIATQKIDAGLSQVEALDDLAEVTTSEGFKEYLVIVRQVSQTGGGIDKALQDLYILLQNRRKTQLQEKVSKLSAKMSVVMMLFLFPALVIVLGGPGFTAISRAFSGMAGGG